MSDGPPCLETFMSTKVQQGTRDVVLFHYSVYAKRNGQKNGKIKYLSLIKSIWNSH